MNLLNDFCIYISSEKGLSNNTLQAYERDLKAFFEFVHQDVLPVTEETILQFLAHLKKQSYASSSISRSLFAIKVFYRFLKREGIIEKNPTLYLSSPKLWQLIPEVLSLDEVEMLLKAPDPETPLGKRDRAILELLYSSGLRVSELCQLKLIEVGDEFLRVHGKGGKERMVPLGKKALEAINAYLDNNTEKNRYLFLNRLNRPFTRIAIWKMIKHYGKKAQIQKNISPHTLRHCFATHLIDHGADLRVIQELLGHASISSTERYTHISRTHLTEAFSHFHPRP